MTYTLLQVYNKKKATTSHVKVLTTILYGWWNSVVARPSKPSLRKPNKKKNMDSSITLPTGSQELIFDWPWRESCGNHAKNCSLINYATFYAQKDFNPRFIDIMFEYEQGEHVNAFKSPGPNVTMHEEQTWLRPPICSVW